MAMIENRLPVAAITFSKICTFWWMWICYDGKLTKIYPMTESAFGEAQHSVWTLLFVIVLGVVLNKGGINQCATVLCEGDIQMVKDECTAAAREQQWRLLVADGSTTETYGEGMMHWGRVRAYCRGHTALCLDIFLYCKLWSLWQRFSLIGCWKMKDVYTCG